MTIIKRKKVHRMTPELYEETRRLAQTMVKAWAPENKAGMESIREILKRYGY